MVDGGIIEAPVPSYAHVLGNPSDAVPPAGMNTIDHPVVNVHGMYTDKRAAEVQADGAVPLWEIVPEVATQLGLL